MQQDLFTPAAQAAAESKVTEAERLDFRAQLISAGSSWRTRADLCTALGWPERKVRACAESMGAEVVRCRLGFKMLDQITPEEESLVREAIAVFHSQAAKMEEYSKALTYRLSTRVG